jgi:preprotein translocase subunit YajC
MASPDGGANPMGTLFMLAAFFAILYFLLIRPQRQQQKEHQNLIENLRKGDEVVTVGGIMGTIIHIGEDRLTIKTANDTRLEIERSKVGRRVEGAAEG